MQNLKKLPIGVQDFKEIREEDYLYVDKTEPIYKLITSGKYYFLSRPRRFGKSLLVSTLKYLFQGERDLFRGLYIYDKDDFTKHPVIHISFRGDMRSPQALIERLLHLLDDNQKELGVNCKNTDNYSVYFEELIREAYEKYNQKVVILIDEYDKPILDNIDQMDVAMENRNILRGLYSVIKDMDPYIRFVFLTGVSKFSKAGIFSGLNNLKDITLYPEFGNMLGITQEELEKHFGEFFKENNVDLEKVKEWYNGYNFLSDLVYNPFDILSFVDDGINNGRFRFDPYWFSSGTPNFLIQVIKKENFYLPEMADLRISKSLLDSFDIETMRAEIVLFQAGYLTIEEERELEFGGTEYKLRIPNKEVRISLSDHILEFYLNIHGFGARKVEGHRALVSGDIEKFGREIEALFAGIPYHNYTGNEIARYEGFYASVIYAYLQSLGYEVRGEDVTNIGRADLTMIMKDKIYIFEIKVDTKESPIKQIKERQYYKKYESQNKAIYLIGINIDTQERNIVGFEWEKMN